MTISNISWILHSAITSLIKDRPYQAWIIQDYPESEEYFLSNFKIQVGVEPIPDSNIVRPVYSSDPTDFGFSYADFLVKVAEYEADEPMRLLREMRDELLLETDWWANTDRTMTKEQKDYREALRDMPASSSPKVDEFG